MNQVLMRSVNTSIVAIMPIVSILVIGAGILGATTLNDFGLALLVGLLTGAYSSIFVASPILAILKEREPRYAGIRQRLAAKGATGTVLTPAAAAALAGGVGGGGGGLAPRPRQGTKTKGAPRPVAKALAPEDDAEDDLLVPARPAGAGQTPAARPKPVPRPGTPRPRKKGKKR
jgi:preprotein translocase subunit SecF